MISIDKAVSLSDFEEMYKIHTSVFLSFDQMTKENFLDEINHKNRLYFVAKKDNEIIGYIGLYEYDDDLSIMGVGVLKSFQNRGVGTKMLNFVKKVAKEKLKKSISLEVDVLNINATLFYKKNGFIVTNIRKKYYKDNDALVMFYYL